MQINIVFLGVISLLIWGFIWRQVVLSPLGWVSPTALFATGILVFYVFPPLYWQFRPWTYFIDPYFEGIPLVLKGTIILGIPFLIGAGAKLPFKKNNREKIQISREEYGNKLWIFMIPILIGAGWRIYLLTLGWQGRLSRENPTLMGSEDLALIMYNFCLYYAACYFLLAGFGNKTQQRIGKLLWILDGFFQLFLLHRYAIILYLSRSLIFAKIMGWKITVKQWVMVILLAMFVFSIVGNTSFTIGEEGNKETFLTVSDVYGILQKTGVNYFDGDYKRTGFSSEANNRLLAAFDDMMFRLNDARSAAAVMMNVPRVIPYFKGETLLHIVYSLIPRYLWPEKPDLTDIHRITAIVMDDKTGGLNPAGTIAELYMNYGFIFVCIGGVICFLLCQWNERILTRPGGINPAWACMYPIFTEYLLFASYNFTQRICEIIRRSVVLLFVILLLKLLAKKKRDIGLFDNGETLMLPDKKLIDETA